MALSEEPKISESPCYKTDPANKRSQFKLVGKLRETVKMRSINRWGKETSN